MATTMTEEGKGLECPKFSGKDEDYQFWITKFEAYAKVKGFYTVPAGCVKKVYDDIKKNTRLTLLCRL